MKPRGRISLLLVFCIIVSSILSAHSGRTDRYGGHNNRKTGGYHYHNAGSVHATGNSFQDHTRCGICSTSKKQSVNIKASNKPTDYEIILALQAGLKCMGYNVTKVDGKMGSETKAAIKKFIAIRN